MKKMRIIRVVLCLFGVLFFTVNARSALVENGDGTITDTDTGLMWLQDASLGGWKDWNDAMAWADALIYAGYDDWRLPSALNSDGSGPCNGFNCIDSELGHIFYVELGNNAWYSGCTYGVNCGLVNTGPFENLYPYIFWTGTEYASDPNRAWLFNFVEGNQDYIHKRGDDNVWAVRVIPEPISSALFIVGGVTLGFRRFWKNRKTA